MVSQISLEQRIFRETEFVYSFLCTINLYNTFGSFCVSIKCISILVYELCCTIMKNMVEILHGYWPSHLKKGRPTLHSAAYRSNFLVLIAAFIISHHSGYRSSMLYHHEV